MGLNVFRRGKLLRRQIIIDSFVVLTGTCWRPRKTWTRTATLLVYHFSCRTRKMTAVVPQSHRSEREIESAGSRRHVEHPSVTMLSEKVRVL